MTAFWGRQIQGCRENRLKPLKSPEKRVIPSCRLLTKKPLLERPHVEPIRPIVDVGLYPD
jgi:hypothetical protein